MKVQPQHLLVVSCLVRNAQEQILMVRHKIRGWELPQGRVEENESLEDALHREVLEETGIRIRDPQVATIWSKVSDPSALIVCFRAAFASGEPTPSEETPAVQWVAADEVVARVDHPVNHDRIAGLLKPAGPVAMHSYSTNPYRTLS